MRIGIHSLSLQFLPFVDYDCAERVVIEEQYIIF